MLKSRIFRDYCRAAATIEALLRQGTPLTAATALLVVAVAPTHAQPCPAAAPTPTVELTQDSFESHRRKVAVEVYRPREDIPGSKRAGAPVVVLLHGRSGLPFYAERLRELAQHLSGDGAIALIPHYFGALGLTEPPAVTDQTFEAFETALGDTLSYAGRVSGADPARIGVVGFSLGAYLATVRAASDTRIKAIASHGGGLSSRMPSVMKSMPPVLIVHGRGDPIAPVDDANRLAERLRAVGTPVEMELYDEAEHILSGVAWCASVERTTRFMHRRLRR